MRRVLHVAWREFSTTAMTKAFILGAFVVPVVLMAVMAVGFKYLWKQEPPPVDGRLAVIDRSGEVADEIAARLRPSAIAERTGALADEVAGEIEERMGQIGSGVGAAAKASMAATLASMPKIDVEALAAGDDPEQVKTSLRTEKIEPGARLALAVVAADAVTKPKAQARYGGFELFVHAKLDDRVQSEIRTALADAIRHQRIRAAALDPEALEALTDVHAPPTREITAEGERKSLGDERMLVSVGFLAVLMISVIIGGQSLLTTTVEEKSSRIVEVLLSALSPMELMGGKILGQLGVALAVLVIYGGLGGGALVMASLGYMLGPLTLGSLLVFFLLAYVTIGALLAAVGSAVNDMREAQSLQTPVMLIMMIPYLLWMPISRDPHGTFATVCSFIPPVNAFVMILRVTAAEPPPLWQVLASMGVGILGVWGAVWAAAKVFRIGLLMFGKPPNFATLVRWVRMA